MASRKDAQKSGIAIVGMACVYPGAHSPGELWQNVLAGRRHFRRFPAERLPREQYYDPDPEAPGRSYADQMAVVTGWSFDPIAFRIPPITYQTTDIAHWLALHTALEALRDSGLDLKMLDRSRFGAIIGNTLTGEFSRTSYLRFRWPYVERAARNAMLDQGYSEQNVHAMLEAFAHHFLSPFPEINEDTLAGNMSNTIAGRICNYFDLGGGGFAVDGACSSSLLAVAHACNAIVNRDLDYAVTGGVDISLDPFEVVGFAKTRALAADDILPYDERAEGMLPGEGCGVFVLMREDEAKAQNRHIHALIRGWGYSSDGSGGITAPRVEGQMRALQRTYERAGYGIGEVELFEGHGTGTTLGDEVEIKALRELIDDSDGEGSCWIGSIKGDIGHCKAAAGAAGLMKAIMAVKRKIIPPTGNCAVPSHVFGRPMGRLRPALQGMPWSGDHGPRRASVSAMGFGGSNAHITIEEVNNDETSRQGDIALLRSSRPAELILLSAKSEEALATKIGAVARTAGRISRAELIDLAAALANEDHTGAWRVAVIADAPWRLSARLTEIQDKLATGGSLREVDDPDTGVFAGKTKEHPWFAALFPGQASQHLNMGRDVLRRYQSIQDFACVADMMVSEVLPGGLLSRIHISPYEVNEQTWEQHGRDLRDTRLAQPAIVLTSLALQEVLSIHGLKPGLFIGHSLGEISAFCAAGAFDAQTAVMLAAHRGRIMASLPQDMQGAMAAINADHASVGLLIQAHAPSLGIANYNSPRQTVVSGSAVEVEKIIAACRHEEIRAVRLPVSHAFHSEAVRPADEEFRLILQSVDMHGLAGTVVSTCLARRIEQSDGLRRLLAEQITSPVRFLDAVRLAAEREPDFWVEIGPGSVLSGLVRDVLGDQRVECFPMDIEGEDSSTLLYRLLGRAFVLGCSVNTRSLFAERFYRPFSPYEYAPVLIMNPCERPVSPLSKTADKADMVLQALLPAGIEPERFAAYLDRRGDYLREMIALDYRYTAEAPIQEQTAPQPPPGTPSAELEEDIVRYALDWIAKRTGYPRNTLTPAMKLYDDLNLDSIKAGEFALILSRKMKLPSVPDPGKFANSSIGDIIEHLRLSSDGSAAPADASKGFTPTAEVIGALGDWNHAFRVTSQQLPPDADLQSPLEQGKSAVIISACTDERYEAVRTRLENARIQSWHADLQIPAEALDLPADLSAIVVLLPGTERSFFDCTEEEFDLRVEGLGTFLFNLFKQIILGRDEGLSGIRTVVVRSYGPGRDKEADIDAGAAFLKTLKLEYGGFLPKWVCLPEEWSDERWGSTVLRELQSTSPKVWFQYRGDGTRLTDVAVPHKEQSAASDAADIGGVMVVTGGAKGITFELASAFARKTGVAIGLIGTSPLPEPVLGDSRDEMANNLRKLEEDGLRYAYEACDVTDRVALQHAVDALQRKLGRVTMILHGAGLTRPAPFSRMDLKDYLSCIRVKTKGLYNLLSLIPAGQLRHLHVLSSVLGRTGMAGQADYTFANAWLDGAVQAYLGEHGSTSGFSIGYSVWSDVGLGKRMGAAATLGALGVVPVSTERGVAMYLDLALGRSEGIFIGTGRLTPTLDALLYDQLSMKRNRFTGRVLRGIPMTEVVTEVELSHAEDLYLPEHVFQGTALMPGVMGIEAMVSAAMLCAGSSELPVLTGLRFLRPLIVPEDASMTARVYGLVMERSGERMTIRVAVRSESDGYRENHFEAECVFGAERGDEPPHLELSTLPEAVPLTIGAFEPLPLFQGKLFRRITAVRERIVGRRGITEIRVPEDAGYFGLGQPTATSTPSPAVRDSCLQSAGLILPEMCLPAGIAKIRWQRDVNPGENLICVSELTGRDGDGYLVTITLFDEAGSPVEVLDDVLFKPTKAGLGSAEQSRPAYQDLSTDGSLFKSLFGELPYAGAAIAHTDEGMPAGMSATTDHVGLKERGLIAARKAAAIFASKRLGLQVAPELFSVRNDESGRPWLVVAERNLAEAFQGIDISLSDGGDVTVACVGQAPVGVDIELVEGRDAQLWLGLLGEDGYDLARRVARTIGEPFDVSATRVWTLIESGKKATALERMIPKLEGPAPAGWVSFSAGENGTSLRFSSTVVTLYGTSRLAVISFAAGAGRGEFGSAAVDDGKEAPIQEQVNAEIRAFFEGMEHFSRMSSSDPDHPETEQHYVVFNEFLSSTPERLQHFASRLAPELKRASQLSMSGTLLSHIRKHVESVPFRRALEKPLGYPGDYLLMDMMLKQEITARGVGYHFDRKFLEYPGSEGVRQRTYWVLERLTRLLASRKNRSLTVLDLGCGPMTIEKLFAESVGPDVQLRFLGLDIDDHAISYARSRITSANASIEIRPCNLLGEDGARNIRELAPVADVCVCMGFFDYLDPETTSVFLEGVRTQIRLGTPVLFANYQPNHAARPAMEWLLDWWLVYKTEQEMRRIAEKAGFRPDAVLTRLDPSGSIVLVEAIA